MRIFDYFSMVSSPSLVLAHLQSRSKLRIELDAPQVASTHAILSKFCSPQCGQTDLLRASVLSLHCNLQPSVQLAAPFYRLLLIVVLNGSQCKIG